MTLPTHIESAHDLCLRGAEFKSRLGHQISGLAFVVIFSGPFRQMQGDYLSVMH